MDIKFKPLSNYIVFEAKDRDKGAIILNDEQLPLSRIEFIVLAVSEETDTEGRPLVKKVKVGDKIMPDAIYMERGQRIWVEERNTALYGRPKFAEFYKKDMNTWG